MEKYRLPSSSEKADYVQSQFNGIAQKYDRFNDWNSFRLHRIWKRKMVSELDRLSNPPYRVMDLCCGTGDIAALLCGREDVEELYAVDFSENMLSVAHSRLDSIPKAHVQKGDAMDLSEFESNSFDAVTIGFGLRNVTDLRKTLKEVKRILKPGGIFLNLDVGKVKIPIIREIAHFYFFHIVPILGYFIWGGKNEMFDYLPASSTTYPDQKTLGFILQEEGFSEVSYRNFVFGNAVLHRARV